MAGAKHSYQWLADDAVIRDATDSTYVLDAADAGKAVRVRVSFTDDGGNVRWEFTIVPVSASDVTVVLPPTAACGDASDEIEARRAPQAADAL